MAEHFVGVIFRPGARLALELAGIRHDGIGLLLGDANDLLFGGDRHGLAAGVVDETRAFGIGIVQKALTLAHDLAGLGEFPGEGFANLIHDLEGLVDVDLTEIVLAEDRLRVLKKDGKLLDEPQYSRFVHVFPS